MRALLVLAALVGTGLALAFLRLAAERSPPVRRCEICGAELPRDPLAVAELCDWHWALGGDA